MNVKETLEAINERWGQADTSPHTRHVLVEAYWHLTRYQEILQSTGLPEPTVASYQIEHFGRVLD